MRSACSKAARTARSQPQPVSTPRAADGALQKALAALRKSERPLMVIGSQAVVQAGEAHALAAAVQKLGIPVYLSGMARGLLGRDDPLQMRHQRRVALREADCVLLAGVPCDFRLDYGKHVRRSATLIAANRSAKDARLNRRPNVLRWAMPASSSAGWPTRWAHRRSLGRLVRHAAPARRRARGRDRRAGRGAGEHVNPLAFFRALEAEAGDNAIFVADGGDFVATASYVLHPRAPLSWLDPGAFGTLGVGAGFAIGAAQARPGSEVWIVWGDGACGWGLAEFDSMVRQGIPVIAVVGNDAGWTQIAREQVKMLHDDVATVLARSDYHRVAAGFGAEGLLVQHADQVHPALQGRANWRVRARWCWSTCGSTRPSSAKARYRCKASGGPSRPSSPARAPACRPAPPRGAPGTARGRGGRGPGRAAPHTSS